MEFERSKPIRPEMEMAPLIDVVFLLLIFYMLTSSFIQPEAIGVELPTSDTAVASDDSPISIVVRSEITVEVNGDLVLVENLEEHLRELLKTSGDRPISLSAAAGGQVQTFVSVLDAVKRAGGQNINIQTRRFGK